MLNEKMHNVMEDVNREIAEREELVHMIALALLTRKNLFVLGDTGQAKSYAIDMFRARITDAKQFNIVMSKQTTAEELSDGLICPASFREMYPIPCLPKMKPIKKWLLM